MKNKKMEYFTIMQGEIKANCYCGDNCEDIEPLWDIYCDGDKEGSEDQEPIVLDLKDFPYGTQVIVQVPCCPNCSSQADLWIDKENKFLGKCKCGFDWREWVEDQYS